MRFIMAQCYQVDPLLSVADQMGRAHVACIDQMLARQAVALGELRCATTAVIS
jgi:hypothetical protein